MALVERSFMKFIIIFIILTSGVSMAQLNHKTLNLYVDELPPDLDGLNTHSYTHWTLVYNMADRLVEFGDKGKLIGNLAESFDITQDKKTYTFYLHRGRRFHNGE